MPQTLKERHFDCQFAVYADITMAKYTAPISETMRQRVLALPRGVKFSAFMERAIILFVEELEKNPELTPEDFVLARSNRKSTSNRKRV